MRLNSMSPAILRETWGGKPQLLEGFSISHAARPRSDIDLHVRTLRTSTRFPWPRPVPGLVPIFWVPTCASNPPLPQGERGGAPVRPAPEGTGIPKAADLRRPRTFISPPGLFKTH
ncbi:hypothetical protein JTE90_020887 [Oedothorax gibbosus]|uniref:Uncharacterized protein n=1 Tax=Oedothorax gibbosus TaxID=931172 RepID=A0AAV6TDL6_9ARAC|nr:hypothetical protein JTE90_020887 [Oedothorax gibbosus]